MAAKTGVSLNWGGFDKALDKAAQQLANTQSLMESVGAALVSSTLKRFEEEEDPQGKKWAPSARAAEKGGQTLTDTSRLRGSIDYAATQGKVMVGSNLKYARIHQMGGKAGRGRKVTLPARPYLGVSEEDMEEVKGTLKDFLAGAFTS